jgi:hypothetical protein
MKILKKNLQIRPKALSNDVDTDSACEDIDDDFNDEDVKPMIPQNVINMADEALSGLPPRCQTVFNRSFQSCFRFKDFDILETSSVKKL